MLAPERKRAGRLAAVNADGMFCGYASLFGRMDLSGDVVEPGAFQRSLGRCRTESVGLLHEHDPAKVIGYWLRLEEDRRGLWVEGQLSQTAAARETMRAMAGGRLDGLSIGYSTVASRYQSGVRYLSEIDLWEVSVVATPMLPEARARAGGAERDTWSSRSAAAAATATAVDAGLTARMRHATTLFHQMR